MGVVPDFQGQRRMGLDMMRLRHGKRRQMWGMALGKCFWYVKGCSALPAYIVPAVFAIRPLPSQATPVSQQQRMHCYHTQVRTSKADFVHWACLSQTESAEYTLIAL